MMDKIKLLLAVLFVVAGLAGFYLLTDYPMIVRVLSVLGGLIAGVAMARFTVPGQLFAGFARESWVEAGKVVWPTRKETLQSTGVVMAFVLAMAIFMWLVDSGLGWVMKMAMGRG
ncbi:MAG TPA: preprotein translocase subunit SecE [Thiobacillaceae bacterium]|nr:preprotein translocase subunit SecE [Thiobacillaceae bacterium]